MCIQISKINIYSLYSQPQTDSILYQSSYEESTKDRLLLIHKYILNIFRLTLNIDFQNMRENCNYKKLHQIPIISSHTIGWNHQSTRMPLKSTRMPLNFNLYVFLKAEINRL